MTPRSRTRALGLAGLFRDAVADALGCTEADLAPAWRDWCEAASLFVFAESKMEHVAGVGALVFTASRLEVPGPNPLEVP